ncbi:MAG: undecaprenyl-phosphate glucose phosphotransferase [Candidatus Pacebacteria bacterium]|nr:undecaprenyl-phosphate glucose phosphotransferase [Candidatus Paceibacterota bacterium]
MLTGPFPSLSRTAETTGSASPRSIFGTPIKRDSLLGIVELSLDSATIIGTLFCLAIYWEGAVLPPYYVLALLLFTLTFPGGSRLNQSILEVFRDLLISWLLVAGLFWLFGIPSKLADHFDRNVILHWLWLAPTIQLGAHGALRAATPYLLAMHGEVKQGIIVGINDQGLAMAQQIHADPYCGTTVLGFFDDRKNDRLTGKHDFKILGRVTELPAYVRNHRIDVIYLSLPMARQPRILDLLDALRDTTASIYFIPDIFVTDLIQGRMDVIGNMPVVAICETPFTGINGIIKASADFLLALLILLLISPLLLIIAIGVRLTSPGPVIFKQHRYGLDGEEIRVYKFRTMTVCENGEHIRQAQKDDQRITPLGRFLRKTSFDELPQFFNVLQGRMSIVGPRPHAVAHNELYRKLIKGYMVRHKVKPGITGWAQVNGLRGETETLEKMKARIDFDLDYLRNWTPMLDIKIIIKTIGLLLKDQHAH